MEDIWINTAKGKIFGKTAGSGSLVLGLHGWSQQNGWQTWSPLIEPLADAGYHVVSVDMPGWGQSPPLNDAGKLTSDQAVEVVLALLDSLGASRATLMGKSWGGGIALQMALTHPKRVTKLILTAPAFRNFGRLAEMTQPVLLAWAEDDNVIPIRHAREFAERMLQIEIVTYKTGGHSAAPRNAADFAPKAIRFLRD